MDSFDSLLKCMEDLSDSLSAFVANYGVAEAIALDAISVEAAPPAVALSDFFHYCVAKGSKHIRAVLVLLQNGFPEDAIVLSRAAYECYISAAYARAQGVKAIDDLVYNTVGLDAKTVEYARNKAGGIDYRRLVDSESGIVYDAPPSIEKMIRDSGYPSDVLVHRHFYGFSSEHAHVNMAGSGNYREGAFYVDHGNGQRRNAVLFAAYVAAILLGVAIATSDINHKEKARITRELRSAIKQINSMVAKHFKDTPDDLVSGIRTRLDQVIQ